MITPKDPSDPLFRFSFRPPVLAIAVLLTVAFASRAALSAAEPIRRFSAPNTPGIARAVRVEDLPLAHTAMMLGWNDAGRIEGDVRAQATRALRHVERALATVGSSLEHVVKVHVYVTKEEDAAAANAALAEVFSARPVATAWVTTQLPDVTARVGFDVVAAVTGGKPGVNATAVAGLPATAAGAHIALLPPGRRIFVSGQAEKDSNLRGATKKTMESLGRTLEWLKATKTDVVQVKAFIRPFGEIREAAEEIARFFAGGTVPPCVFVEWANPSNYAEIEMVVSGGKDGKPIADGVAFLTPPGLVPSPRFARIAVVDARHPLIFISGLYGLTVGSGREEWSEIFRQLGDILWETGSSMRHQVKGTYYSSTNESRRLHTEIRDVFFDPARPPASSGMMTRGTGRPGKASTIDMIAIPIPKAESGSGERRAP